MKWCTNYLETWSNNRGKKPTLCWWCAYTWNNQWKLNKNELGHICGWSYLRSKFGRWLSSSNSNANLKLCWTLSPAPCWRHITTLALMYSSSIAKGIITTKIFGYMCGWALWYCNGCQGLIVNHFHTTYYRIHAPNDLQIFLLTIGQCPKIHFCNCCNLFSPQ